MKLTKEQEKIINSKELSFKINAVAANGTTTTLLDYAKTTSNSNSFFLSYCN